MGRLSTWCGVISVPRRTSASLKPPLVPRLLQKIQNIRRLQDSNLRPQRGIAIVLECIRGYRVNHSAKAPCTSDKIYQYD
jgi:hypothetical protein